MAGIEDGISTVLAYAADDANGYVLKSGNHASYSGGTDCAGLVRMYAAAVEGVELSTYPDFGTWDERDTLTSRGWTAITFAESRMQRGDVLLRALGDSTGHTVVYLGNSRIVGAEGNYDGKSGDGSGTEICEKAYYAYSYNYILRPPAESEDEVTDSDIDKIAARVWSCGTGSWTASRLTRLMWMIKAMCGVGKWDYDTSAEDYDGIAANTLGRLERCTRMLKGLCGISQDSTDAGEISTPMSVTLSDADVERVADAVYKRMTNNA